MRIRGWHIDGFGIHRDWRVDELGPGLSVFYGPNEAGKSTLVAFLRGVLFGFPDGRSSEPKYPPAGGGRHGGRLALETGNGVVVVERFAGRGGKLSVTLEGGRAGDALDLAERLGSADARLFRNVYAFGLGELQELDTLGEAGVQDQLFSAGVTGAGRSARRAGRELGEAARDLFAGSRARKSDRARALIGAISERRGELNRRREAAARHPELLGRERALATRIDRLEAEADLQRAAERRAHKLVELWNEMWSPLADMREQAAKLAAGGGDGLPADARFRLESALQTIQDARDRLDAVRGERTALDLELGELRFDDAARAVAPRVEALHQELALVRSRRDRLAEIDAQIAECDGRCASIAEQLPGALGALEVRALLPAAARRDELRDWKRRFEVAREAGVAPASIRPASRSARSVGSLLAGAVFALCAGLVAGLFAGTAVLASEALAWLAAAGLAAALAVAGAWRARAAAAARAEDARRLAAIEGERRAREQRLAELERGFSAWKRELGIPENLGSDLVAELLEDVRRARDLLEERDRLSADRRRVVTEVAAWEAGVDAVLADGTPTAPAGARDRVAALGALRERCEADRAARERRRPLQSRDARLRERFVACDAALSGALASLASLLEDAGADDVDELRRRLAARDAARELVARIAVAEAELVRRIESAGPEEARALRAELPRGRVAEWEEQALEARAGTVRVRKERDEALRAHQSAMLELERLEQSTEVVDLELEKSALEQELREVVDEWRQLRLASRLIESALERFEGRHQPGVLGEAGRLFARVTGGRYPRIVPSDERAGFSVIAADGLHRSPRELSRGTAEQLYLCVRLGLVAERARARVPLPVVMDDVLVDFDDERAAAMAGVLAEFARDHQLFFFTCSSRTRDLLLAAAPDADTRTFA
jgi:uncharacterized protein YhaN